jgi:hypothetical protein
MEGGEASIWPSIGNHDFACASHYVIKNGKILWAGRMSRTAIEAGRERDRRLKRPPAIVPATRPAPAANPASPPRRGVFRSALNWITAVFRKILG